MAFDRGLVAEDVLSLIDERGLKFISALDHDQIPKVPNIDLSIFKDLDSQTALESIAHLPGFTKFDSDLYFKDFGTTGDKRYHQKRYNPSFRRTKRNIRCYRISKDVEVFSNLFFIKVL
jgi:hypothetical protein